MFWGGVRTKSTHLIASSLHFLKTPKISIKIKTQLLSLIYSSAHLHCLALAMSIYCFKQDFLTADPLLGGHQGEGKG